MAKFTNAWRATLAGYFDAGDQPTAAQFAQLMLSIQEGIEEHDHAGGGDGDGISVLTSLTNLSVGTSTTLGKISITSTGNTLYIRPSDANENWKAGFYTSVANNEFFMVNGAAVQVVKLVANGASYLKGGTFTVGDLGGGGAQDVGADNNGLLYVPFVSDRKFKDNIKPLTEGLDIVKALRPVTFDWNSEELAKVGLNFGDSGQQVGLIAQEVVEVIPQAKSVGKQYKAYDRSMIVPYLIEAVKELDVRLTKLEV